MVTRSKKRKPKLSEQGPHSARVKSNTRDAWYYIEKGGVTVVAELGTAKDGYLGTTQAVLTPTQIRRAAALLDRF